MKMKNLILIILFVLLTASKNENNNDAEVFHVKIVGGEQVEKFKSKFPNIVNDRTVYIAYLQQYYRGHEEEFIYLIRNN